MHTNVTHPGWFLCLTGSRRLNKRMAVIIDSLRASGHGVRVASLPRGRWWFGVFEQTVRASTGTFAVDIEGPCTGRMAGVVCFHWIVLPLAVLIGLLRRIPVLYDEHDHYELNTLEGTGSALKRRVMQKLVRGVHRVCLPRISAATCIHMLNGTLHRHLTRWQPEVIELHNYPMRIWRDAATEMTPAGPLCFVYIGGVYAVKGVQAAAEAFEALPEATRRQAEFHLFGTGDTELIECLRQRPGIVIHDEVTPARFREFACVRRCCGLALLLGQPRYNLVGTNCTKVFEYLALGMPVLATRVGELPAIIGGNHVGLLVDPRLDVTELSAMMTALINNPARYDEFSANARRLMNQDEMTWEHEWRKVSSRGLFGSDSLRPVAVGA